MSAPQCPECHKFTSPGGIEVDLADVTAQDDTVTGTVTVSLLCTHCGAEYAKQDFEFSPAACCCETPKVETQDESAEAYEGQLDIGTEKKPNVVASYGADVKIGVHCVHCNQYFNLEERVESPASEYEPVS